MTLFSGLGHVGLHVKDLDAAAAWYQEKLDFQPTMRFPTDEAPSPILESIGAKAMLLEANGVILEMVELAKSEAHPMQFREHIEVLGFRGFGHLCLRVDDCHRAFAALTDRGVAFSIEPMAWPDLGFTNAHFFDNEGNDLELMSFDR